MKLTRLITFLLVIATAVCARGALTAGQIMDKAAKKLTGPASVTVTFTIASDRTGTTTGSLTMGARKFTFTVAGLSVWYDGKTQWTLNRQTKEVSITTPTAAELTESNPFYILSDYRSKYHCKALKGTAGQYKIQLTPKAKGASVRSVTVTVRQKDFQPLELVITPQSGAAVTVKVKSIAAGKALPASYFRFDPARHKDYEVIDLR